MDAIQGIGLGSRGVLGRNCTNGQKVMSMMLRLFAGMQRIWPPLKGTVMIKKVRRIYTGKYPHRVREVIGQKGQGLTVVLNNGTIYTRVVPLYMGVGRPKVGKDFQLTD